MKTLTLTLVFAVASFAQQPPPAAYENVLAALNAPASALPATLKKAPARKKTAEEDAPLELARELPIPDNARVALSLSKSVIDGDPQPHLSSDGHVVFTFGKGMPTIITALKQVTEIDLEPGETVNKDGIDRGDERLSYDIGKAATGPNGFNYLALKPTALGIDTSMTIGTDRRVYYLRVQSTSSQFIARAAFSYPEDEAAHKKAVEEETEALAKEEAKNAAMLAALASKTAVTSWKYTVEQHGRDSRYLLPLSVGDDGVHTHIQLSQQARTRGLPVLQIKDATGPIPANSHWENNELIVDALFQDGCLLQGVGKKQQRVCIHNLGLAKQGVSTDGN